MSKLMEYEVTKSTRPDYEWMVTARDISKPDGFPYAICFVNRVFIDDYGVAQAIAKSLQSSNIMPSLEI